MLVDLKPMVGLCSINITSLLDSPSQLFSTSECFRTDLVSMSYFGPYLFPHHLERVAQRLWAPVLQLVYKTSSKSEEIIM